MSLSRRKFLRSTILAAMATPLAACVAKPKVSVNGYNVTVNVSSDGRFTALYVAECDDGITFVADAVTGLVHRYPADGWWNVYNAICRMEERECRKHGLQCQYLGLDAISQSALCTSYPERCAAKSVKPFLPDTYAQSLIEMGLA